MTIQSRKTNTTGSRLLCGLLLLVPLTRTIVSSAFLPFSNSNPSPDIADSKRVELLFSRQQDNDNLAVDLPPSQGNDGKNENEETSTVSSPSSSPGALWDRFSALTLAAVNLTESVGFYQSLGLGISYDGESFVTLQYPLDVPQHQASIYINLFASPKYETDNRWGRVVIYVKDVDGMYDLVTSEGLVPEFAPRNAPWGERYFHIRDPSGHELSFAKPLTVVE